MKYMKFGNSGLTGSAITFGAMPLGGGSWWSNSNDEESIRTVHRAIDLGITVFDTAPVYGYGHSEEILGQAVKGRRDQVLISTKCGLWWDDDEGTYHFTNDGHVVRRNVSRRVIKLELEKSLKRLGTDYIDIYYTHNPAKPPFDTPVEETVGTLMELKKEGKIRAIGASNMTVPQMEEYLKYGEIDFAQKKYSIMTRDIEKDMLPFCQEHDVVLHAYATIERGLLTGKITKDYTYSEGDARGDQPWWRPERFPYAVDFVDSLRDMCEKYQCSMVNLSTAWLRAQSPNVNVICGARRVPQIEESALGCEVELMPEDVQEIRRRAEELDEKIKDL